MEYRSYNIRNYKEIPQIDTLPDSEKFEMEVVARVLPFKTNNYVVDELINWENYKDDPIFNLNFPQKKMLQPEHYDWIAQLIHSGASKTELDTVVNDIRFELNPHPAGQREYNIPELNGVKLRGIQHKYNEVILFFPSQGQTCHAYCTFCFRWPQFTGSNELRFAMTQTDLLVEYLKQNPEVTDVLFTGGDPMVMNYSILSRYLNAILEAKLPNISNIRIGTKSLSFWPYRYLTENDSQDILNLFKKVIDSGLHLAFMAHFSHPKELSTPAVLKAVNLIRQTGAQIRTQSPVLNRINADPKIWADMWKKQVALGMIPYYMFVARDTGANEFFGVSLEKAWQIYKDAYKQVSGICRTARGPCMSANPGKVRIAGVSHVGNEKVFVLTFIQARNPDWVGRPFFAKYNDKAYWLTDLKPALGEEEFFYSKDFRRMLKIDDDSISIFSEELNSFFNRCQD